MPDPFTPYPLLLTTALRRYAFGARLIPERLGRAGLPDGVIAETWEVSDHAAEPATVRNGAYAGVALGELVQRYPDEVVAPGWRGPHLPLLVKLLDASHALPVHVHPDDAAAAARYGDPNGKDEAWHVLWAAEGASVLVGVRPGVTRERLRASLLAGAAADVMLRHPVRSGDTVDVPAGVLHTFGPDTLILEVQQTSDLAEHAMPTDVYGRPLARATWEANVDATLDLLTSDARPRPGPGRVVRDDRAVRVVEGCRNDRYVLERWTLRGPWRGRLGEGGFVTCTNLGAPVAVEYPGGMLTLDTATSCLLPAASGALRWVPGAGVLATDVVVCYEPRRSEGRA